MVGDSDRQWLESHYFDSIIRPLGKIRTIDDTAHSKRG